MEFLEKRVTDDGSISFYNKNIGDIYHSKVGAYTEALEKFIRPSKILDNLDNYSCINVLDVCFGLGYNTKVLTNCIFQLAPAKSINIFAIEIDPCIIQKSTEIDFLGYDHNLKNFFDTFLHKVYYTTISNQYSGCEIFEDSYNNFNLKLFVGDARKSLGSLDTHFDMIFHDPFSPNKLPELWTTQVFTLLYRLLKDNGILLTYSSAASVRGAMLESGLSIGNTLPIGRKSPGTLASKNSTMIEYSLSKYESELIESTAGIPYEDEGLNLSSSQIIANRELKQAESSRISSSQVRKKHNM